MGEMPVDRLDLHTANRLLSGRVRPDDAPPGFAGVARLLDDAAAPSAPIARDAESERTIVAAMQRAVLRTAESPVAPGHLVSVPDRRKRSSMRSKLLSAKTAGAATAALILAGGTAAAATGALHSSAPTASHVSTTTTTSGSSGFSGGFGAVGTHDTTPPTGTSGSTGTGPSPNADFGLCNAASHNGGDPGHSRVFPLPAGTCTNVTPKTSTTSGTDDSSDGPDTEDGNAQGQDTDGPDTDTDAPGTPTSEPTTTEAPENDSDGPGTTTGSTDDGHDGGAGTSTTSFPGHD